MPEQYEQGTSQFTNEIEYFAKLIEDGKTKMPEWWVQVASQLAYNLQVHTKGLMFDKVTGLYPNEHPDSQKP